MRHLPDSRHWRLGPVADTAITNARQFIRGRQEQLCLLLQTHTSFQGIPVTEDALQRLISAVEQHYQVRNPQPLLLSSFGQRNKGLLTELKGAYGSLKAAIHAAGEDRIRYIDTRAGREAIAPASNAAELRQQIEEVSASQHQEANSFTALPIPVQIAFCVRTAAGEHIAIETVRPFRFAKITVPELIRPTQRIVPESYRRPGLALKSASLEDRASLWRLFLAWTENAKVDPTVFRQGEPTNALARFIAAQPVDMISRLVIPADIAQILLKYP